jgi:hypothetical protein
MQKYRRLICGVAVVERSIPVEQHDEALLG